MEKFVENGDEVYVAYIKAYSNDKKEQRRMINDQIKMHQDKIRYWKKLKTELNLD